MLTLSLRTGRWGRFGAAMSCLLVYQLWPWFAIAGKLVRGARILIKYCLSAVTAGGSLISLLSESIRLNIQPKEEMQEKNASENYLSGIRR